MPTTLTLKATIKTMVAVYQANVSRAEQSFSEIVQAQAALNAVFDLEGSSTVVIYPAGKYVRDSFDWVSCEKTLRRGAWTAIVERTEIARVLSPSKAKELRVWLDGELPELTEENVEREVARFAGELAPRSGSNALLRRPRFP